MKKPLLLISLLLLGAVLKGDEAPALDLFAGWGWSPYWFGRYPFFHGCYAPYPYAYPTVGVGVPVYPWTEGCLYPGTAWRDVYDGPCWGYFYGTRLLLREPRYHAVLSENLLPPLPGSAPTELRNPERAREWEQTVESFLGTIDQEAWLRAVTNTPAGQSRKSANKKVVR